jgi:spore coat polysaccharide biosynthesis protein SpsF (cytidylyltransferase family)
LKIIAIVQARMGSNRFPGKVLEKIGDKCVIQYIIDTLKNIKMQNEIDDFVIATPNTDENKPLWDYLDNNRIPYFKGSNEDVLDRYYNCAKKNNAEGIVRICADVPFLKADKIIQQINNFRKDGEFTYGNGAWVFSFEELEESWKNGNHQEDREHVTTRMFNAVDYPEDLEKLRKNFSTIQKNE